MGNAQVSKGLSIAIGPAIEFRLQHQVCFHVISNPSVVVITLLIAVSRRNVAHPITAAAPVPIDSKTPVIPAGRELLKAV
jgi:hypothetical protein